MLEFHDQASSTDCTILVANERYLAEACRTSHRIPSTQVLPEELVAQALPFPSCREKTALSFKFAGHVQPFLGREVQLDLANMHK